MSVFKVIKSIQAKQVFGLFRLFIQHPIFTLVSVKATLDTYSIAQKEFPDIHGGLNKANAFRHALWCVLLSKYCARYTREKKKAIAWAKQFTDWHEDLFVNEDLARYMDLHNNQFGLNFFSNHETLSKADFVSSLKSELELSIKIKEVPDVMETSKMVYLED